MRHLMRSGNDANQDIPLTRTVIERPSLDDLLNTIRNYRVILVSAPPGYGKTTTIARFVRGNEMPCAWHTIEERERDLPTLHLHSLRALEFVAPEISSNTAIVTNPGESVSYITSYLRDHAREHFLYVLDDLQLIARSPSVEQWLNALVESLPPNCHLILISRALPDLPLAELIAKGDVLAIGHEQLRFREDDANIFADFAASGFSEDQLRSRIRKLEGWPAGLALALQPSANDVEIDLLKDEAKPEALFDALAEIMLSRQSPVLRDFLLSSSTLSKLTPEICERVLELPDSSTLLSQLIQRNLFIHQISGGLVLHRLFREFLQRKLSSLDTDRFLRLHWKAGQWFHSRHEFDMAFHHYIAAEAKSAALELVEQANQAYFNQGKFETLLMWLSILADDAAQSPQFLLTCGMIYTDRYMFSAAETELARAEKEFLIRDDQTNLARVTLQRALIYLRHGAYDDVIESVLPIIQNQGLSSKAVGRAKHLLALSHLETGSVTDAVGLLEQVLTLNEARNDLFAVSSALQDLDIAYTRNGQLESANQCLKRLVAIRRKLNNPGALAIALNNLGYHYHQRGYYAEAIQTFEEGLSLITEGANLRARSYLLWSLADVKRDLGLFSEAEQLYGLAYELAGGAEPLLLRSISLSMSILYRWQNKHGLSKRLAQEVVDELGDSPPTSMLLLAKALVLISSQEYEDHILAELREQLNQLSVLKSRIEYGHVAILCAFGAVSVEEFDLAEDYLLRGIEELDPQFEIQPIIAEVAHTPLLLQLLERNNRFDLIRNSVVKLSAYSSRQNIIKPLSIENVSDGTTFSLRIHTLGTESIERDGQVVPHSEWAASRAREVFMYLQFEGAVSREEISLVFWPDSAPKRVRSNFHTTLYRIRQALGENVVLFNNGRYQINPNIEVWCDALELEKYVHQAQLLPPTDVLAQELFLKAIDLYEGEFLTSIFADWVTVRRRRLEDAYLDALLGAGKCAQVRQGYWDAIAVYKRALEVNPFREEAYRELFVSYARLGEKQKILRHFSEMKSLFVLELGVHPSQKTLDLIDTLVRQS